MRYMPPKLKRSGVWSFLLMLAGISLYISSAFVPKYVSVVQAVSFAFFAFSIYIITRYVLTPYYYEIDGENFRIVKVTGKKMEEKKYYRHSGYVGGLKTTTLATMLETKPAEVLKAAVRGMLPKNRLGRDMLKKLKVYTGPEHPHAAQAPKALTLTY